MIEGLDARVVAVASDSEHRFSKQPSRQVTLLIGQGVAGDAHAGRTVKHRSRVAVDPDQPNLRQVHLLHSELLDALNSDGFAVGPGDLGENVTTAGLDLLALPWHTRLRIGEAALIEVTGLRNPCRQIEAFRTGLLAEVVDRASDGRVIRKAGVMAIVVESGIVRPGDRIEVSLPSRPYLPLEPV